MRKPTAEVRLLGVLAAVQALSLLCILRVDTSTTQGAGSGGFDASLLLFTLILAATVLMLALIKWGLSSYLYLFSTYGGVFTVTWFLAIIVLESGTGALALAALATACCAVVRTAATRFAMSLVISIGASVMMGLFFGPVALIGLMVLLSAYDYIAVRKTRHMIRLAEDVMEKRGPQMIVVGSPDSSIMIGLADLIFPSALFVSAYIFTSPATALLSAAFSHAGLAIMMRTMGQEGMPALPYGSLGIVGYLVGAALGI